MFRVQTHRGSRLVCETRSLRLAARAARQEAMQGRNALLTGPDGFLARVYRPDMAHKRRWWYHQLCPQCGGRMYPDSRTKTCRQCWKPSEAHLAEFDKVRVSKEKTDD